MRVLIIEDETIAAQRLQIMLKACDASIEILDAIESIEETIAWLSGNPHPDLLMLDIQLADGLSFEIFRHVNYNKPVIFTTAYSEYALDAFRYYSVDYLVKPITFTALQAALDKLKKMTLPDIQDYATVFKNIRQFTPEQYKERFLVKLGQKFIFIKTTEVAYFKAEDKLAYIIDKKGNRFLIDYTLEKLESLLDPRFFFRLNRRMIVSIDSILQVKQYGSNRLQLQLQHSCATEDLIVSRDRVADFRVWAGQ